MARDYLEAEGLIIARLQAAAPSFRAVMGVGELGQVDEATQIVPAAHVIFQGEAFAPSKGGHGAAQVVTQRWLVIVAVESARDPLSGSGARASAGTLIGEVIEALSGYELKTGWRPMARVPALGPAYEGSFAYFPLAYDVTFTGA